MTANLNQEHDAANTEHLQTFDQSVMGQIAALKARFGVERAGVVAREQEARKAQFRADCARADEIIAQYLLVCTESMRVPPEKRDWEYVMRLSLEEVSSEVDSEKTSAKRNSRPNVTEQDLICEKHELRESAITARRVVAFLTQAGIEYKIERVDSDNVRSYRIMALAR